MKEVHVQDAKIFKALCDPKRLYILSLLKDGEKCACKLMEELAIGQSALSYHMKILCESNIVKGRAEGKWVHYSISESGAMCAIEKLKDITNVKEHTESGCK